MRQLLIIITLALLSASCANKKIKIVSYILRDRIILLDKLVMKKVLFVAFRINESNEEYNGSQICGTVSCAGKKLAQHRVQRFKGKYGNLVFDLPYNIPDGKYEIEISVSSYHGNQQTKTCISLDRSELKPYDYRKKKKPKLPYEELHQSNEENRFVPSEMDRERGYVLFSRSPLEYIYPGARPHKREIVDSFTLTIAQNEFEPLTFTLYPLDDLGWVTISTSDLVGSESTISNKCIEIAHVEEVDSTIGLAHGKFQRIPRMLRLTNRVEVGKGSCERLWLTVRIEPEVKAGLYEGTIYINPQHGKKCSLPLKIKVVPITLTDIPGIDYFMLMTYEFVELTMPWNASDRIKIYNSAINIFKDYKEHGMTTVCLHSPFVLIENEDGSPNLADIFTALYAAQEVGFTRPIIYYLGHLVQTAKYMHPGNINGFEKTVEIPKLRLIVKKVTRFAKEHNCPEIIFCPVVEPHDKYNDPSGKRLCITPILLKAIHEMNAKTMITTHKLSDDADYICSSKLDKDTLSYAHKKGTTYWMYNNAVTLKTNNPAYARYIYGYYVWQTGIDGMTSWTFQTTQNARGLPTLADTVTDDVYLAYPDHVGPLATIEWEAIREGIDDHKLVYQLTRRIKQLKNLDVDTYIYEDFLGRLKEKQLSPNLALENYGDWPTDQFMRNRELLMCMILDSQEKIAICTKTSTNVILRGAK